MFQVAEGKLPADYLVCYLPFSLRKVLRKIYSIDKFGINKKARFLQRAFSFFIPGSALLSHAVSHAVPSALEGLTSVFGMGTGVTPPLWPPKSVVNSEWAPTCAAPSRTS